MSVKINVRAKGVQIQEQSESKASEKKNADPLVAQPPLSYAPDVSTLFEHAAINWSAPASRRYSRRRLSPAVHKEWKQMFFAIGGAILVGTVMGLLLLSFFFSSHSVQTPHSVDSPVQDSPQPKEEGVKEQPKTATLPALQAVLVQAGNFQSKEGAQKMLYSLRTKGYAAVMSSQSPYKIFLGIGFSQDDALKLSSLYQEKQVAVILKEHTISSDKAVISGDASELGSSLADAVQLGNQLVTELGKLSVERIASQNTQPFPFQEQWGEKYRQYVTKSQSLSSHLPEAAREALSEMTRGVDQAVQSAQEAKINPSQALLWQMQEGIVRYTLAYEELVRQLSQGR